MKLNNFFLNVHGAKCWATKERQDKVHVFEMFTLIKMDELSDKKG